MFYCFLYLFMNTIGAQREVITKCLSCIILWIYSITFLWFVLNVLNSRFFQCNYSNLKFELKLNISFS